MRQVRYLVLIILCWGCKDKYNPVIKGPSTGFLVVEGFINTGSDSTFISLSRSSGLDSIYVNPETGAHLEIQSEAGADFPLTELSGGKYGAAPILIDPAQKYRLHISTSKGKEYLSDFSEVKFSPPIDSVNWTAGAEALTTFVTTHDNTGKSIYYEWNYTETWKYSAAFISDLIYQPPIPFISRPDGGRYFTCYKTSESTEIELASSAKLSSDVIAQFPFAQISYFSSNRLYSRYSMLVKQTVLSQEAYQWKQKLKRNTEELGSIFDPQPSQTGGNIRCISDPAEQVIGFVWCTSQTVKRIFIERSEIPNVRVPTGYEFCVADTVELSPVALELHFANGNELPLNYFTLQPSMVQVMLGGGLDCIDCRLQGGTIVKPDFW